MLFVIMTKSLIRLDSAVRASLNDDAMTETDSGITRSYGDYNERYNVGTRDYDSITRSYRRERDGVGTNTNNDDITRGYN